jgi:hypothetical protein
MSKGLVATSKYIPKREALFVQVDLSDYLIDYYLHRKDHAPDTTFEHDQKLKELITCFAIHLSGRTAQETHAWTVHLVADTPYSLFVTGNNGIIEDNGLAHGFLVGHILTENIRHTDVNSLHAQFTNRGRSFNSMVRCETNDIREIVERYYSQSEQYPLRIKISDNSDTALGLIALPEYDEEWIRSVDLNTVQQELTGTAVEATSVRTCHFAFKCDCSPEKLVPFFRSLDEGALNDLYRGDTELSITCPRCGRGFSLPRELVRGGN